MQGATTVVITGGAGFVGTNLALYLREKLGWTVYCFDNLKRRGSETNLPLLKKAGVAFVHGDIRNKSDFLLLPQSCDFLVEASAEPSVLAGSSQGSLSYLLDTNLVGSLNCFQYAFESKAKIIFLSTSRIYPIAHLSSMTLEEDSLRFRAAANQALPGVSEKGISEKFPLEGSRSFYGATKLASELFLPEFKVFMGVEYVINRFGVIAGPGQFGKVDQGVTVLWVARHYFAKELSYIGYGGEGKQVRDVLHIADFCTAVEWQLLNFETCKGETFNIGGGKDCSVSLAELTSLCQLVTGQKVPIRKVPENRKADIPWYVTDNTKFSSLSGWRPQKTPLDIVTDIYKWIDANKSTLQGILDN